jgi:curli biogenesis system outer membrane secretion channel CsgG
VDFAGDYGGQALADILTMQLRRAGFQVVERDNLRRVVDEQKMGTQKEGTLDLTDKERLELIGRNITADIIITGELVRLVQVRYEREAEDRVKFPPATCELTARAVDSKTGRVVWTCVVNVTATARDGQYVKPIDPIVEACAELVESLKNTQYKDKTGSYSGPKIGEMRKARLVKS